MNNSIQNDTKRAFFPKRNEINNVPEQKQNEKNSFYKQNNLNFSPNPEDQIAIDEKTIDFSKFKKAAIDEKEIDNSKKIEKLKDKINNGKYNIDYDQLAEKLIYEN